MNLFRRENDKHLRFWAPTPLPPRPHAKGPKNSTHRIYPWNGANLGEIILVSLPNFVRKFAAEIFPGQWRGEDEEREGGRLGRRRRGGSGADVGQNRIAVFRCGKIARQNCLQGSVAGKSSLRQNRLQTSAAEKSASKTENIQQSEVSKKKLLRTSKKKRKHEKPKIYEENTKNFQTNTKENPLRAKKHQERPSSPDACRANEATLSCTSRSAHVVCQTKPVVV